jgi:hypothetical protein
VRCDLEPIEETMTREDLCGFAAMCGLRAETHLRCSTLFLAELYLRARTALTLGYPAKIIFEVQTMEGYGRASQTKEATQFKHSSLRGLWHKHYLTEDGFAVNTMLGLGGPSLKRIRDLVEQQRRAGATHFTAADVPRLATAVAGTFARRAARAQLTGDWIVYAKHECQQYYLCLGTHSDDDDYDQMLRSRILQTCAIEFPFLEMLMSNNAPHEYEHP